MKHFFKRVLSLLTALSMIGTMSGGLTNVWAADVVKIACVGDSITAGSQSSDATMYSYPAQLQSILGSEKYEVKNFGYSGKAVLFNKDRSYNVTAQYTDSIAYGADIVIFMLGTNDVNYYNASNFSDESGNFDEEAFNEQFKADMTTLIKAYQEVSKTVYIANTPTSFRGTSENSNLAKIAELQAEVATELGCLLIDVRNFTSSMSNGVHYADGLHPNDTGYAQLAQYFYQEVFDGNLYDVTIQTEANVDVHFGAQTLSSGISGEVVFPAAPGTYDVMVSAPGYLITYSDTVSVVDADVTVSAVLGTKLENLAYNKTATTQYIAANGANGPSNAVDGDTDTRWGTPTNVSQLLTDVAAQFSDNDAYRAARPGQWLTVDLGAKKSFNQIVFVWNDCYAKDYYIQTSDDGQTFTTIHSVTNSSGGVETVNLDDTQARYVRMQGVTESDGTYGYSIHEMEIYNTSADSNGDSYTRSLSVITDMVHDNPGGNPYVTKYDDCAYIAQQGLSGKVFFLSEAAQLAIDWQDYDANVFPVGSDGYNWVQDKKAELHTKYKEAKDQGLKVYFMMDFISLPTSMKTLYGDDILTDGKIDINKAKTQEIMKEMMREIFTEFPEVDGIYPRYGESYVGFYSGYHTGNNPIGVSATDKNDHITLLKFFRDEVCEKYNKEIVYRTWSTSTGDGSFTTSPSLYLEITNQVEPHDNLYIAIKHTAGDFWRNYTFNETIGIGNHQQIIEIQCAREYEGKGAYPNYIAGGVINGFPEYEWQMSDTANKSLRDVVNCENSKVVGVWTWSRGGGWGGPYINGTEVPEGDEPWSDLNAYVLHKWAQDTSRTDTSLVKQYAKEVLGMNDTDATNFVRLAELSADAVLNGIGTDSSPAWNAMWTRDASVIKSTFNSNLNIMYSNTSNGNYTKLLERRQAVANYEEMLAIAESFDDSVAMKDYINVTTQYGYYFFAICERMWTAGILTMESSADGVDRSSQLDLVRLDYDTLWLQWKQLKLSNACCPSLYTESMFAEIMDQYVTKSDINEDNMATTIGSYTNFALGRPASAKYTDSNFPSNAVDGDSSTKWGTPSDAEDRASQWLQIDLGLDTTFNRVSIEWESDTSCAKEYKLQVSDDGVNFRDIVHVTDCTGGTMVHDFDTVTARYIRMQGIAENGKYGYSIMEFGVYNTELPEMTLVTSDNLALNCDASASYQHNAFAPSYVTDGDNDNTDKDTSKRWNAGNIANTECWISVDLGTIQKINRTVIYWNMKNCPFGYDIQVSTDNQNWTTVKSVLVGNTGSNEAADYVITSNFDTTRARYVRVYVSAANRPSDTQNWVSMIEFEVYNRYYATTEQGDNLAASKTTSASYQHNAFAPSYVTDNDNDNSNKDTSKRWNAGNIASTECWIYVDLGAVTTFNRTKIYWNLKNCPSAYQIQISNDASTWTTVQTVNCGLINSNNTADYILTHDFASCSARYLRVYVPAESRASDTQNWVSMVELEVYNVQYVTSDTIRPGDADNNGTVNAVDMTVLARHLAGVELIESTSVLSACDLDGTAGVTASDLTVLARILARIA